MDFLYIRAIERILICLIAAMCIWLGFSLFKIKKVTKDANGEFTIKTESIEVTLKQVWPGVFFAAFGMIVLVFSILSKYEYKNEGK